MTGSFPAATPASTTTAPVSQSQHWISRLAKKVRLTGPAFVAAEQMSAEEIAALTPAANAR